jgi:CubicO group peptidase (beta-lactamase class C family)
VAALLLVAVAPGSLAAQDGAAYVPSRDHWETRAPEEVGMDPVLLSEAVAFAEANETSVARDQELSQTQSFNRNEPFGHGIGPFKVRGGAAGVVVKDGYIVAEWGDTRRVDMTHSVTKSFLSTVVGLAWQDGLIPDLDEVVAARMAPVDVPEGDGEEGVDRTAFGEPDLTTLFTSPHNRRITWNHLLRQTSDWAGTLWGKPDWADRPSRDASTWLGRDRPPPGSRYEYNDTRVNLLALAALSVIRRPLPEVLRERVMDPIGASPTWRWHGYDNSWVPLDGRMVQSVSGGGHWGGGMFISARDQARFGLFTLRRGRWGDARILDEAWFEMALTPTPAQPTYGFMNYFLNRPDEDGEKRYPSAPDEAWAHLGNGTNMVYVDPVHDLVVVARWIPGRAIDELLGRIIASIEE